jgi:hypothetical protein
MAIIDGRPLPPQPLPELPRRVIVRFKAHAAPPSEAEPATRRAPAWQELARRYPTIKFRPHFAGPSAGHPDAERRLLSPAGQRLRRYFEIDVPPGVDPVAMARELGAVEEVETAYVDPGPIPPPVNPSDDPRSVNQRYLDAAPVGIGARWAWMQADGTGVGFVDMERGWTLDHEDLAAANIGLISGLSRDYHGHGTAVLGQVVAVDNTRGCIGIAPGATARVVSQWRNASNYNTAEAITQAAAAMGPGDVLLLEAQTSYPGYGDNYLPVEVYDDVFDAIRAAVDDGIIVVEAAGNGGVDLDDFRTTVGALVLNRTSADFRDSGAIMVGAASSSVPHVRSGFSNHGSRIDCFGWGDAIDTCGDGYTGTSTTAYTSAFGGTSGASPIVSGAALIMQSWAMKRSLPRFDPAGMRALLADPLLNTASQNPSVDRIGVMPNLRAIIEARDPFPKSRFDRWAIAVRILFGVTNDGGGLVWVPGRGPIPIGPWTTNVEHVTPAVRDTLASLAIFEMAALVGDQATQTSMRSAALDAAQRSMERLTLRR